MKAFFAVDQPVWSGFLAGYPGLPNNEQHESWPKRLAFALSLFLQMPWKVRIAMVLFAISHTFQFGPNTLLRSLFPEAIFAKDGDDDDVSVSILPVGEEPAKEEAREMMKAFATSCAAGLDPWSDVGGISDSRNSIGLDNTESSVHASLAVQRSGLTSESELMFPAPFN